MSWDVLLTPVPPGTLSIEDLADGKEPPPLGAKAEVLARLEAALPRATFKDAAWGELVADDCVIELNVGQDDPVRAVMLHVRGGDGAMGPIRAAAKALGCAALDCSAGELLDLEREDAGAGLEAWREYRDRVVEPPPSPATDRALKKKASGVLEVGKAPARKPTAKGAGRQAGAKPPKSKKNKRGQ